MQTEVILIDGFISWDMISQDVPVNIIYPTHLSSFAERHTSVNNLV